MSTPEKTYSDGLREAARICDVLALRAEIDSQPLSFRVSAKPAPARFELLGDGQVIDQQTGLIWMRDTLPGGRQNWHEAKKACETLSFAGHTDWRLPTVEELLTLVDRSRHSPAIVSDLFRCEPAWYWSSTPLASSPGGVAWFVSFGNGFASWYGHGNVGFVRAVRSAPASQ